MSLHRKLIRDQLLGLFLLVVFACLIRAFLLCGDHDACHDKHDPSKFDSRTLIWGPSIWSGPDQWEVDLNLGLNSPNLCNFCS